MQTFEESKPRNLPSYAKHYAYINLHENWTLRVCDHHKPGTISYILCSSCVSESTHYMKMNIQRTFTRKIV